MPDWLRFTNFGGNQLNFVVLKILFYTTARRYCLCIYLEKEHRVKQEYYKVN